MADMEQPKARSINRYQKTISFGRNSSSESPFTDADSSESSEDIPLPSNTNSIVDSSIELAHEVFRCSTPL